MKRETIERALLHGVEMSVACSLEPIPSAATGGEHGLREKEMKMRHSIVSGVDGSEESRVAAMVAADLAQELDLRLVIAHVADDPPTFPYGDLRLTELQRRRGVQAVQGLFDSIAGSLIVVPETRIVHGNPVDGLKRVASDEQAELLVVGSRGRSGIAAALSGSVSTRLASESAVPVLVVSDEAGARFVAGLGGEAAAGLRAAA